MFPPGADGAGRGMHEGSGLVAKAMEPEPSLHAPCAWGIADRSAA